MTTKGKRQAPRPLPAVTPRPTPEEQICTTWCFENASDGAVCKRLCMSLDSANYSLYRRSLLRAAEDGLQEPHQHIFAAGAVWAWLHMTGLLKKEGIEK